MNLSSTRNRLGLAVAVLIITIIGIVVFMSKSRGVEVKEGSVRSQADSAGQATPAELAFSDTLPKGAILTTSMGEIEVAFFAVKAPKTVANFAKLAREQFYDDTRFHRVIKDFMIQGGDPLSRDDAAKARWGTGGPGYAFVDEFNDEKIVRGVLAMANAGPNTNGSQFFIVTVQATPWLDGKHTVFGKVVRGMEIIDRISAVATGERDIPKEPVVIEDIKLQ